MSPSELESIISERAAQRAHAELLDNGRAVLGEAIEALDQARRDLLYGAEPTLIELAVLIARRVIARELKTQPELVNDLVREGIDALASRDKIRIQLGTGFSMMAVMVSEQLAMSGIAAELSIDPSLPEYGCVVESDIGRVDESIEARLAAVLEAIDAEEKA
jgi:flagellar assembly protein FliH